MTITTLAEFAAATDVHVDDVELRYVSTSPKDDAYYQSHAGTVGFVLRDNEDGLNLRTYRKLITADVHTTDAPGDAGTVLVVAHAHYAQPHCVLRVVTDPINDAELAKTIRTEVQEVLASSLRSNHRQVDGVGRAVLDQSSDPVLRRLKTVVETAELLSVQTARYELQCTLSEHGFGRINGLDVMQFDALPAEAFAAVLITLVRGYRHASPSGALYYVAKKGTKKEEFAAWYDSRLAHYNWDAGVLVDLFETAHASGLELEARDFDAFSSDRAQAFLDLVESSRVKALDREGQRKLALGGLLTEGLTRDPSVRFDALAAARPSRSLAELKDDASAPDLERYCALVKAREAGIDPLDDNVVEVFAQMSKLLRITLVRNTGAPQKWAAEVLMEGDRRVRANRA